MKIILFSTRNERFVLPLAIYFALQPNQTLNTKKSPAEKAAFDKEFDNRYSKLLKIVNATVGNGW
jgi:hypothetical protein